MEEKVKELMMAAMRSGEFVGKDQEVLAARIVDSARREFKLQWNRELEGYSGMRAEVFQEVEVLRPITDLQTPQKPSQPTHNSA